MKKYILFSLSLFVFTSCRQDIKETDLAKLNGYWEIETVILKDGSKKDYKVNPAIDFISLKGNKGFRQKVTPQFDGTYQTNGLREVVSVSRNDGGFYLNYTTPYGKWKEALIEIRDSVLVVKNTAEIEYHYKRQRPFSLK